jgi:hypothetical protein
VKKNMIHADKIAACREQNVHDHLLEVNVPSNQRWYRKGRSFPHQAMPCMTMTQDLVGFPEVFYGV